MRIVVVNAHDDMEKLRTGEYVGRASSGASAPASPLANPYRIGADGDRETVVARYEAHLRSRIHAGDREVLDELARLASIVVRDRSLTLVCWCAPARCHADIIRRTLLEVLEEEPV